MSQSEKIAEVNVNTRPSQMLGTKHPILEAVYGSISGLAFGLLSPLASQPFDTIKTKMQAESKFATQGPFTVGRTIFAADGIRGLYRGMVPIVLSTGVQKSALFAGYAGARRWCQASEISVLTSPIPLMNGMDASVLVGAVVASTARTAVETPFELAKVRSQTGGSWMVGSFRTPQDALKQLKECYTGVGATWGRATVMLTAFFVLCDQSERAAPDVMSRPLLGGFIKGGICATMAWGVSWPLEVVKSKVQGVEAHRFKGQSMWTILAHTARNEGLRGLYRGFLPGAMRSFAANGVGMAAYQLTQSMRKD